MDNILKSKHFTNQFIILVNQDDNEIDLTKRDYYKIKSPQIEKIECLNRKKKW